jgi:hypothetical protein
MDSEMQEGMKFLYNALLKVAEFPGERPHNPKNLNAWNMNLNFLHQFMIQYYAKETLERYKKTVAKLTEVSRLYPSERYIVYGYEASFEFLGVISRGYADKQILRENPGGLRIIYDLVVQAMSFSENNNMNLSNVVKWQDRLNAVHQILSPYHPETYIREYKIIRTMGIRASTFYPSEKYIHEIIDVFLDWIGALSRMLESLQIVIPETLTYSDPVKSKKKSGGKRNDKVSN